MTVSAADHSRRLWPQRRRSRVGYGAMSQLNAVW